MKRRAVTWSVVLLILASWATSCLASDFEISGLLLGSWAGIDGGSAAYTGLLCEAMAEYWFGANGYPAFSNDLTGDGEVDERDVEALAQQRSEELSDYYEAFDPAVGIEDCWLLGGSVFYFGEVYPNEFRFKVYDDTIEAENLAVKGRPLDLQNYADTGVTVELYGNATRANYISDLQQGAAILVGLGPEGAYKTYFVAYGYDTNSQGSVWPVAFADTEDDPFAPGLQGQILNTYLREGDPWWYAQYGAWQPIEFMLSILPVRTTTGTPAGPGREPPPPPSNDDCSGDTRRTDVSTPDGDFIVLEMEARNMPGDVDVYSYELTNVDHPGLCTFSIPTNGLTAVNLYNTDPYGCWIANTSDSANWTWNYDTTICGGSGLLPGESVTFGVEVPSPTTDIEDDGYVTNCAAEQVPVPGVVETPDVSGDWIICAGGNCGSITIQQSGLHFSGNSTDIPGIEQYTIDGTISLNRTPPPVGAGYGDWDYPVSANITIVYPSTPGYRGLGTVMQEDQGKLVAGDAVYEDGTCQMWGWWMPLTISGDFSRSYGRTPCFPVVDWTVLPSYEFVTCCPVGNAMPPEGDQSCSTSPGNIRFGSVDVGTSVCKYFHVENTGTQAIAGAISIVGANADEFAVDVSCPRYDLANHGDQQTCRVCFSPTTPGSKVAQIFFHGSNLACPTIELFGDGEEEGQPDLVITQLSACYDLDGSEWVLKITGRLKNQGNAQATNCGVSFQVSHGCSTFPIICTGVSVGTLGVGDQTPFSYEVAIPDPNDCGPFGVEGISRCAETESDDTNNDAWTQANDTCRVM